MKNLSKQYRDKSAISNKSEFATLKGLRNDIVEPDDNNNQESALNDLNNDVLSSKNKSAKKRKHRHKDRSSKRGEKKIDEDRSTKR